MAAELYQSGMTLKQVADVMGFTEGGIQLRLKQAGVPRRKPGTPPKPVDPGMAQLRNEMLAARSAAARVKREKGATARRKAEAAAAALQSVKAKGVVARTAREELRAECRAAAGAGAGYTAIALAAGVARSTALHWITD